MYNIIIVENGYFNIVKCLIEFGVEMDIEDKFGQVPFHFAYKYGFKNIVKYLSEHEHGVSYQKI